MKINLRGNAVAAAVEQLVVGASFLIFYGVLIREAGADVVGVLSLVLVLASIGMMANAGFGSAIARFAPTFEGRGDRASTVRCIETAMLCTAGLYAGLLVVAYFPFRAMITSQVGEDHAGLVSELMIPATIYVFMMGAGSVTTLALTALQRSDLRMWANMLGAVLCLIWVIAGAPVYGVVAGLWALAAQSTLVLILTWSQLRRVVPELSLVPWRFNVAMARNLLTIGVNLQAQSLLVAALEPVSRLLIGHFGSLADVTYFSMAARFVLQVRALIFASAQPLLSAFSYLRETDPDALGKLYGRVNTIIGFMTMMALSATAGAAPFVGEVWIGERQDIFVILAVILVLGWIPNTLVLGSYFIAYAMGRMKYNLISHIVMVLLNLVLGPTLGVLAGSIGVAAGLAVSLIASGVIMGVGNRRLMPARKNPWGWTHVFLAASATLAAVASITSYYWLRGFHGPFVSGIFCGAIWLAVITPAALQNPGRRLVFSTLRLGGAANEG